MNKKKLMAILMGLLVVAGSMLGLFLATRPDTTAGAKEITVTVVHKDGTQKVVTYQTDEEYLGPVILSDGLVEGEQGPYGLMISAVDGEAAVWEVDQSYWSILIGPNEEYATTGADAIVINDGDVFKLVYTIG